MTTTHKLHNLLGFTIAACLVVLALFAMPVSAHDGDDHGDDETHSASQKVVYTYTAQPGDTYIQFARKAVQTYGKVHKVSLSVGQIVYAETALSAEAGHPVLNVGEERTFEESSVKQIIDKAKELSEQQVSAWAYYAQFINFNTDRVGEASNN